MIGIGSLSLICILFVAAPYVYALSVNITECERRMGNRAREICRRLRVASAAMFGLMAVCYFVFAFDPVPAPPLPRFPPWPRRVSAVAAALAGGPAAALVYLGIAAAGRRTLVPSEEGGLFGGIYARLRHPQSEGAMLFLLALALALHSTVLLAFSLLNIPVWAVTCLEEEKDLIRRYGEKYRSYRKKAGFFFPRFRGVNLAP